MRTDDHHARDLRRQDPRDLPRVARHLQRHHVGRGETGREHLERLRRRLDPARQPHCPGLRDRDLAEVAMHVHPDRPEHSHLLALDDAGAQVGKRHRRIRAHSTTGPVAGAATENPGLAAHQS